MTPALSTAADSPWARLDQVFARDNLCQALPNGEELNFENENCTKIAGCDAWNFKVRLTCKDEKGQYIANISHYKSNGKRYSSRDINEDFWALHQGNLFRIFAANIESFGNSFHLKSLTEDEDQVVVKYLVKRDSKDIQSGQWVIGKDISKSIYSQLIERSQKDLGFLKESKHIRRLP